MREYLSCNNQITEKARTMTDLPIKRSFKDDFGVEIMFYDWPVANPKAVIQIAHGLGEHARRYDSMAATLNKAGFSVYADDHRGHGQTGLKQLENKQIKRLGNLGPGGMAATYKQVADFSKLIKAENPNRPLVLLGHSWGSFIAQKIINKYSDIYDAVFLSGSALTMPGYLATGDFNKVWKKLPGSTGYEWLSRDVKIQNKFVEDPLTFLALAMQVFGVKNSLYSFSGLLQKTLEKTYQSLFRWERPTQSVESIPTKPLLRLIGKTLALTTFNYSFTTSAGTRSITSSTRKRLLKI
jgi:pimeloyl-ACP methyl ester carboxylesterase